MAISIEAYLISHLGKVRKSNQDNFVFLGYISEDSREKTNLKTSEHSNTHHFFTAGVFDGMGGESYGELASLTAAKEYRNFADTEFNNPINQTDLPESLQRFYQKANAAVCTECRRKKSRMGTTASILVLTETRAVISNIGDSRIYRIRNGEIALLTKDHTEKSLLLDNNLQPSKRKGRLTQYLGIFEEEYIIEPHIHVQEVCENDVYLICSDGITDMLSDHEIEFVINERSSLEQATIELVEYALQKGGIDNITAILCLLRRQ